MKYREAPTQRYLRISYEIIFSSYFALLVIWLNARTAVTPWGLRVTLLLHPDHYPHSFLDPSLRVAISGLWLLLAVSTFFAVRLLGRLSRTKYLSRMFVGVCAITGFPLAYAYSHQRFDWFVVIETVGVITCAFLCVYAKSRFLGILSYVALFAHFAIWTVAAWGSTGPGWLLLWPGWDVISLTRHHPDLIYPLLGFCVALLLSFYLRNSRLETRGNQGQTERF